MRERTFTRWEVRLRSLPSAEATARWYRESPVRVKVELAEVELGSA